MIFKIINGQLDRGRSRHTERKVCKETARPALNFKLGLLTHVNLKTDPDFIISVTKTVNLQPLDGSNIPLSQYCLSDERPFICKC